MAAVTVTSGPYSSPTVFHLPEDGEFMVHFFLTNLFCVYTAPSGPPTNFNVKALSSDSLQVTWNPPLPEEQNGIITHYVVTITNLNNGVEMEHIVGNTSIVVSLLDPHTQYDVFVLAATAAGIGPATSPLSVHTHEDGKL